MYAFVSDDTELVADVPGSVLLDTLPEGQEAVLQLGERCLVPVRVKMYGGRCVLLWQASARMRKKDELGTITDPTLHVSVYQPLFKFVNTNGSRLVRCLLVDQGYLETSPESPHFDVLWTGKHIKKSLLQGFNAYQRINHFPRTFEITRKDRLFKNVHAMSKLHPDGSFDFLPKTYVLPEEHAQLRKRLLKADGRWILKPNSSSRGRGIFIIRDLLDVSAAAVERCVVCRYIDNPLLINGLKFDLRIYVAVTSFFPLRVWIFDEGLARFATESYRDDGYKNPFIHLTNYSINKKSKKFTLLNPESQEEDLHEAVGSKWTLTAFRRFLRESGVDDVALFERIEACVARAVIAVEGYCTPSMQDWAKYRHSCFELFGFDVLVDDQLKPWVLEVNLSPSLSVESNLDFGVKCGACMLADLFSIAGFEMFHRTRDADKPGQPPFQDTYGVAEMEAMARETRWEQERSGSWKMLVPAVDDRFDSYFPPQRRPAYAYIRQKLFGATQ